MMVVPFVAVALFLTCSVNVECQILQLSFLLPAVAWAPVGKSDHNLILLIPVYRHKPVTKAVKLFRLSVG